jgi:hypothetical protein
VTWGFKLGIKIFNLFISQNFLFYFFYSFRFYFILFFIFFFLLFFSFVFFVYFFFFFVLFCNIINFFSRVLNLFLFLFLFLIIFFLLFILNKGIFFYQDILSLLNNSFYNINYILGFDIISVFFLFLCIFILSLCFLYS